MFRASAPVTSSGFHDRTRELTFLSEAFAALTAGAPRWLALVGPRKIGKTSLIFEAARCAPKGVEVAVLDVLERAPLDLEIFRLLCARAIDALLARSAGGSLSRRLHVPTEWRALLQASSRYTKLPATLRVDLDRLAEEPASPDAVRRWLQLPDDLASAAATKLVVAIDEVQELTSLRARSFEPFPLMRSVWQRHQNVAYIISGSAPSVIRELVTARHAPFFQHFQLFELGPFTTPDAVALLREAAPSDRPIPRRVAERVVKIVGGHPFYLQLVGEALTSDSPPYDEDSLKPVIQALIYSRTGRLALVFENEYRRVVGKAATAAATLQAIAAQAPVKLTQIAKSIGASTASTARYLERLGDAITRDDDGRYGIADPVFASWVRWRSPGGTVVPMSVVGDEAELAVASELSGLGFDLVYQSRALRGAFDLLALRGPYQLGLQVKRRSPPLSFGKREWKRMQADAERWGWRWVIAAVDADGTVQMLDPARARVDRTVRLHSDATIDNVLRWIEADR